MNAEVLALGQEGFAEALELFGETWSRRRDTITPAAGAGKPTITPGTPADVTLIAQWRKGADPLNFHEGSLGAVYANPGTLQAADELTHATHGAYKVREEGAINHQGVYERAEIAKAD